MLQARFGQSEHVFLLYQADSLTSHLLMAQQLTGAN